MPSVNMGTSTNRSSTPITDRYTAIEIESMLSDHLRDNEKQRELNGFTIRNLKQEVRTVMDDCIETLLDAVHWQDELTEHLSSIVPFERQGELLKYAHNNSDLFLREPYSDLSNCADTYSIIGENLQNIVNIEAKEWLKELYNDGDNKYDDGETHWCEIGDVFLEYLANEIVMENDDLYKSISALHDEAIGNEAECNEYADRLREMA